jgi:hypothetical protein
MRIRLRDLPGIRYANNDSRNFTGMQGILRDSLGGDLFCKKNQIKTNQFPGGGCQDFWDMGLLMHRAA